MGTQLGNAWGSAILRDRGGLLSLEHSVVESTRETKEGLDRALMATGPKGDKVFKEAGTNEKRSHGSTMRGQPRCSLLADGLDTCDPKQKSLAVSIADSCLP